MSQDQLLKSALYYAKKFGWSVVPSKDKKALIKWGKYQKERPSEEQIKQWWGKDYRGANISVITGTISNLCVIDIDEHQVPGTIDYMNSLTQESALFPISKTPRGGQHWFFLHEEAAVSKRAIPAVDVKSEGGMIVLPPSNGPNGTKYEWLVKPQAPLELLTLPSTYKNILFNIYSKERDSALHSVTDRTISFDEGNQDNSLFSIAWHLIKGDMPEADVTHVISTLAKICDENCDYEKWALDKVESAIARKNRSSDSLAQSIRDFIADSGVTFALHECDKALGIVTKRDMTNRRQIISRLVKEGVITRDNRRPGIFYVAQTDCPEIEWQSCKPEALSLRWPFDIEKYVNIYPGNIIVLAGEQNAGKTALLLNLAVMNQDKFKVHYFSSEMGPEEMKVRADLFDWVDEWKFKFYERSSQYPDVIKPNDINIIDFLEIHDNFWEVGGIIKDVHDKLGKGIAVIALQKPPGRDIGKGGYTTLEKPRLYLSLSNEYPGHRLKIVKAKNYAQQEVNPNGMSVHFRLASGAYLSQNYKWERM